MVSPSVLSLEGSPTRHQSMLSLRSRSTSTTRRGAVDRRSFLVAGDQEGDACRDAPGGGATNSSQAVTMAARPLFMSAAPRPYSRPSWMTGVKGSLCHSSERPRRHHIGVAGEAKHRRAAARAWPRNYRPGRSAGSRRESRCASRRSIISAWQPPSVGTDRARATSASQVDGQRCSASEAQHRGAGAAGWPTGPTHPERQRGDEHPGRHREPEEAPGDLGAFAGAGEHLDQHLAQRRTP